MQIGEPTHDSGRIHWIQLYLVDDAGKPVPRARFRIQGPDGDRYAGILDRDGSVCLRGIEAGDYSVTFPDLTHIGIRKQPG